MHTDRWLLGGGMYSVLPPSCVSYLVLPFCPRAQCVFGSALRGLRTHGKTKQNGRRENAQKQTGSKKKGCDTKG